LTLCELYEIAEQENIDIDSFSMQANISLSIPNAIGIDYDKIMTTAEEITCLSHELGHCLTYSFYNVFSHCDIRSRHEYRADRWAVHKVLPYDCIISAIKNGCSNTWELSEHFDVTEDFIRRAIYIYECEGHIINDDLNDYFMV